MRGGLRTNRWIQTGSLSPEDLPADVLNDLRTKGNILSVFQIDEVVTAERAAIAVTSGKDKPDETGYAVFDRAEVEALGIGIEKIKEPLADVAASDRHYNLDVGTAGKLVKLAGVIAKAGVTPILARDVEARLLDGIQTRGGHLKSGHRSTAQNRP